MEFPDKFSARRQKLPDIGMPRPLGFTVALELAVGIPYRFHVGLYSSEGPSLGLRLSDARCSTSLGESIQVIETAMLNGDP